MIKKPLLFIVFITLVFTNNRVFAQNDSLILNRNIAALQTYANKYPIEKIHLHLDRPWYGIGDTIWFKAYVVIGKYHRLSALSGVLYAELLNEKDSVLKRLKLELNSGVSHGDFVLPFTYKSGVYRIRAYTNWMRNSDPDYFYDQKVVIAGPLTPGSASVVKTAPLLKSIVTASGDIDVQFFPEGGDLVNGLRSKVAFKAINKEGLAEDIHGVITDTDGNEVASFSTQYLGMGQFSLKPQKGVQYRAKIIRADGSKFIVDLPKAKDKGLSLSINDNSRDSLYLKVAANDEVIKSKEDTTLYLVAQSGGKIYFSAGFKADNWPVLTEIPKSLFPSGIVQFTLLLRNGEPLNERIVFIQNNDQLHLALSAAKQAYAPGEKVSISLDAKNAQDKTIIGTFSVSVIDETKVPVDERAENTIFTDLLLKSELGGYIENPNYYFINTDDKTRADLDMLMLTQGYHRFEWKKILSNDNTSVAYQPEKLLSLAGTVKTPGGKPASNAIVSLASIKQKIVRDTTADDNGNFQFNDLYIIDTTKLYLRSGKKNMDIGIKQPDYPEIAKIDNLSAGYNIAPETIMAMNKQFEDSQGTMENGIALKQVNIRSFSNPFDKSKLTHSDNLNGPGQADQVIMGDELTGCPYLADCLRSLLRGGVRWLADTVYSTHTIREFSGPTKPMAVMIDGMIMDQKSAFGMISESDIYSIEVLETYSYLAVYGSEATGGLIIITTKRGGETKLPVTLAPGLTTYTFQGFYKAREFYSPKYDAKNTISAADNRKTIYWSPDIITDANGKAGFEYFNAGSNGNYRVVVEGIDGNGKLGRQVFNYEVE